MQNRTSRSKVFMVTAICVTIVLCGAIGAWVYIQQQGIAQKDRELLQTKQLKEYEQAQINERAKKERECSNVKNSDGFYTPKYGCSE